MIETGKILQQRYRIDNQIGQGGMGSVYIATDERFGSVVAIKETLLMDDSYRKAIEREARLLNSLKHPALPRVSDHFLEDNGQFLVMEYIPGEDLGQMMEREHHPFSVDEVLKWADQLLDALDYLHNQSIPVIHRDIKPQNLKLTARGQIVLLDFGLAKGNPTDAGHQTAAKSIFGYSKNYASLEQIQGTGTDPRSDLYSLAATLCHLLTGRVPEDALTRAMNVLSHKPDPLVPAHQVRDEVPKGVSAVLYHCMDLNAGARPASAREMRELLTAHEKYQNWTILPAAAATVVQKGDIFTQKTELMGAQTYQEGNKQTDVKTAVIPVYKSQETVVRTNGDILVTHKSRNSLVAAAGIALLACVSAVGAYFYAPALFGQQSEPVKNGEYAANVQASPAPSTDLLSGSALSNANSSESSSKVDQPAEPAEPRFVETSKSQKQAGRRPQTSVGVNNDDGNPNETVYVGNMKIHNGAVETPDVYIDENGIRKNIPRPAIPPINIKPEQLWMMSPVQRRKLMLLMQQQQNLQKQQTRDIPQPATSPEKP